MAIQKNKVLPSGVSGNYWRIISENYDRIARKCHFDIALFKDAEAAFSGKKHLGLVKNYCAPMTREQSLGNRTEFGYAFIKTKAASMVYPITGGDMVCFDSDLSGGEDV